MNFDTDNFDLTFHAYQDKASSTAIYSEQASVVYPSLGLAGEVGELCEKLDASLFSYGVPDPETQPLLDAVHRLYMDFAVIGKRAERLKKLIRDGGDANMVNAEQLQQVQLQTDDLLAEDRLEILKEMGDICWYMAMTSRDLDACLGSVAEGNLRKLEARKNRGMLSGSGDNR